MPKLAMTTYTRNQLETMTVKELRDLAREELGPDSFAALARKNELIKAIIKGSWPEQAFGPRREPKRDPDAERLAKALLKVTSGNPELMGSRVVPVEEIRSAVEAVLRDQLPAVRRTQEKPPTPDLHEQLVGNFLDHLIAFLHTLPEKYRDEIVERLS